MSTPRRFHMARLSRDQIKQLCAMSQQAQKAAKVRFDPKADVDAETWRKRGQEAATAIPGFSLKTATQGHYLEVRGHWFAILGNLEQAFTDFLNAGETSEARRQMAYRLLGQVHRLAEGIQAEKARVAIQIDMSTAAAEAWKYTAALAKDGFKGRRIDSLDASELERLGFTVTNRASAKLRVGSPDTRNKSQRQKRASSPPQEALEPFARPDLTRSPEIPQSGSTRLQTAP